MKRFIGDKTFYKNLFIVALPIVVQQLITSSLQLVDNIMVGQLGDNALAAVGVINQLNFVIILVTFGAMGGAGVLTAQYFGSKDYDKMKQTFRFKLLVGLIVALFSVVFFTIFGKGLVRLFSQDDEVINLALGYLNIVKWAMVPWSVSVAISNTFRETGVTKPLLYISFIAIITNTVLNYFLIFGSYGAPQLGVEGAAIATVISRFVEFGLMTVLLLKKGKNFSTKISKIFHIESSILSSIIILAIPLTLNEAMWSLGQAVFLQAYSTRELALPAMNAAGAISQLVFVTFGGIGTGVAVLVGNTLGKNELHEAKDNARKLIAFAVFFAFMMGIILFIASYYVMDLYSLGDETVKIAQSVIRINAIFIPIYSFNVAIYFTLRSGGDTRSTLMMDSGYMWVVSVPVAMILSRFTNLNVVLLFLMVQFLDIPKMIFAITRYKKGHWVKNLAVQETV
ncbi:MAG: MATE family efflux transporter [Candidatus Izemoplasmatales bacterium]